MRWGIVFADRFWCKISEHEGLTLDTRFAPPLPGGRKPNTCLYVLVRGAWRSHDSASEIFDGPVALAMAYEQLEGADGKRPLTFRIGGAAWVALELHFDNADVQELPLGPVVVELDAPGWDAAVRATSMSTSDDAAVQGGLRELLQRLARMGFLREDAAARLLRSAPSPFDVFWKGLRPLIEQLTFSCTLEDIARATGLSTHQIEREGRRFLNAFALGGPGGARSVILHTRLRVALLFLSAEGATIREIAESVGYGSPEAMAHAFQHAGLLPPSVIQRRLFDEAGAAT